MSAELPVPFVWTRGAGASEVTLSGSVPAWLRGDLVRTAPAVFREGTWHADHWFDGLCLLYGFAVGEQGVTFRQQLLQSGALAEAQAGRMHSAMFATRMERPWWKRLIQPIGRGTDNANVNVIPWRGGWLAMTEAPKQHLIDPVTLATRGVATHGKSPNFDVLTAHPQADFERRAMVNVGAVFSRKSSLVVFRETEDGTRVEEGRLTLDKAPYTHHFGLSPRFVTLIEHPLHINPLKFLFSENSVLDCMAWRPELGTKLWVMNRRDGSSRAWEAPAMFVFHVVNQHEVGDSLVLDVIEYPNADIVSALATAKLAVDQPELGAQLVRYRLKPGEKTARREVLGSTRFELPTINYRARHGQPYRFTWGVSAPRGGAARLSTLVKVDTHSGDAVKFTDPEWLNGEAVFVARPGASEEDDGVVLTVGVHRDGGKTSLSILDAKTLERLARAEIQVSLPLGFHGNWANH